MREKTYTVSLCALLSALGAAVLLTGGLIPVATYCAPLMASLLLVAVTEEFDWRWGWMVWAVTAALGVMLGADKEAAFFYLFLGYYPLLRLWLEERVPRALRMALKLGWAAASVGGMYAVLCLVLRLDELVEELAGTAMWLNAVFFGMLVLVMLLFDRCLTPATLFYRRKLRPRIGRRR